MASANASVEESFFLQIERVRVGPRERVSRSHQVLQEREKILVEDTYRQGFTNNS